MSLYYLDIGVAEGIGLKDGSNINNYMGRNQFVSLTGNVYTLLELGTADFLTRGTWDLSLIDYNNHVVNITADGGSKIQMLGWPGEEPWKIILRRTSAFLVETCYSQIFNFMGFERGIFEGLYNTQISAQDYQELKLNTCSFRAVGVYDPIDDWNGANITLGGTIVGKGNRFGSTPTSLDAQLGSGQTQYNDPSYPNGIAVAGTISLQDSVCECPVFDAGGSSTFVADHCAFISIPEITAKTLTDCQTNWTPASFLTPLYNAAKEDWANSIINAGIATPPEPGVSPYTGYATGLWGEARVGIGAAYFYPLPAFINETPSLNSVTTTDVSYDVEVDADGLVTVGIYLAGKPEPNTEQVLLTVDGNDDPGVDGNNLILTANTPDVISSNPAALSLGTSYDIYFVTSSMDDYQKSSPPIKRSFTTSGAATNTLLSSSSYGILYIDASGNLKFKRNYLSQSNSVITY